MNPIEVSDIDKHYGDLKAVDGISFTVNNGEVIELLGPNGAGKSTTKEILEGLREHTHAQTDQIMGRLGPNGSGKSTTMKMGAKYVETNRQS